VDKQPYKPSKNPLKCNFGLGISTTALFLPIIAIDPLSLYLNGIRALSFRVNLKFLPNSALAESQLAQLVDVH
jgi:hypothetical protein